MKKNTKMALAASAAGLSLLVGGVGVANAVGTSPSVAKITGSARIGHDVGSPFDRVLSVLVAKGTITQAQADAILNEATAERTAGEATRTAERTAQETLIATTIGSDWPTILKRLQAGESLATIAGSKTATLITALVNEANARIDAAVTAGRITAAQATTRKADLQSDITAAVNGTGRMGGPEMRGHHEGTMGGPEMRGHHEGNWSGSMSGFGGPAA